MQTGLTASMSDNDQQSDATNHVSNFLRVSIPIDEVNMRERVHRLEIRDQMKEERLLQSEVQLQIIKEQLRAWEGEVVTRGDVENVAQRAAGAEVARAVAAERRITTTGSVHIHGEAEHIPRHPGWSLLGGLIGSVISFFATTFAVCFLVAVVAAIWKENSRTQTAWQATFNTRQKEHEFLAGLLLMVKRFRVDLTTRVVRVYEDTDLRTLGRGLYDTLWKQGSRLEKDLFAAAQQVLGLKFEHNSTHPRSRPYRLVDPLMGAK